MSIAHAADDGHGYATDASNFSREAYGAKEDNNAKTARDNLLRAARNHAKQLQDIQSNIPMTP